MTRKIAVFHTGGTISMEQDSKTGAVNTRQSHPLLNTESELFDHIEIISKNVLNVPSPHITEKEMLKLQKEIKLVAQDVDGVVITHGTDTLEETAYFLDLTIDVNIPIVITGSMRSSNEIGWDGLTNYISAIRVASSEKARGFGVLVVLNEEIHAARNVTKTHTSNVATFQSPQFGPLGIVTKNGVLMHQKLLFNEYYNVSFITKNVVLLKAYAGMDSMLFDALSELGVDGVVIEALGQGNMPPESVEGIVKLLENGSPVVLVSRCFNGISEDVYAYEGGGKHLKNLGVIFSNGLNGQKARLKLLVALELSSTLEEIEEIFLK